MSTARWVLSEPLLNRSAQSRLLCREARPAFREPTAQTGEGSGQER